jgi:hypothetical protein
MNQPVESTNKKVLTDDQIRELMSYPNHWRSKLLIAAQCGKSISETYEKLKDLEYLM